ncbi:unnamed protein product [Sphagnum balticum]
MTIMTAAYLIDDERDQYHPRAFTLWTRLYEIMAHDGVDHRLAHTFPKLAIEAVRVQSVMRVGCVTFNWWATLGDFPPIF